MSENNQQYIGLTIGPIFDTLKKVKSTRALFSASYLFSYLMRELIVGLKKKGIADKAILTPSAQMIDPSTPPEAGYYPDRLILVAEKDNTFELLKDTYEEVLNDMASGIEQIIKESKASILPYLKSYFQVYFFQDSFDKKNDPFGRINYLLSTLDEFRQFPTDDSDLLQRFLKKRAASFLIKDAFHTRSLMFPTIVEITTQEFEQRNSAVYRELMKEERNTKKIKEGADRKDSDTATDEYVFQRFRTSKAFGELLRPYHKYIAIIHADGDSVGEYIAKLGGDDKRFRDLSDTFFAFNQRAKELIKQYGGRPIFIGGDDLLFLAPMLAEGEGNSKRTIFDLINALDAEFLNYFPQGKPTLSFGLSFTYYKFPLNEARDLSYCQLETVKKDYKKNGKHALRFSFRKQAGASFSADFQITSDGYKKFVEILSNSIGIDNPILFKTFTHTLQFHQETLLALKKHGGVLWEDRVKYTIINNLDEEFHQDNEAFRNSLIDFTILLLKQNQLKNLYACLRIVQFLTSKRDDA